MARGLLLTIGLLSASFAAGVMLPATAASESSSARQTGEAEATDRSVMMANFWGGLGDVLDAADRVLDTVEEQRIRDEARAERERFREEMREQREADAAATEATAPAQSSETASAEGAERIIFADSSPARCDFTDAAGAVQVCNALEIFHVEDLYMFKFDLDDDFVVFQAMAEPARQTDQTTAHLFNLIARGNGIREELGGCVISQPELSGLSTQVMCFSRDSNVDVEFSGSIQ